MNTFRRTLLVYAALLLALSAALPAQAQAPAASIDPGKLPQHTLFYVLWRGAPTPAARSANSLYALWDDPGFAPARNAIFDGFMSESHKSGDIKSQFSREEISEYSALLDNPLAIGFVADQVKNSSAVAPKGQAAAPKWNGFFLIYDRSGKEALLAKALLRLRSTEKNPPTITPTTIAGIPAIKVTHTKDAEYWVESGKYVVSSGEASVIEQILHSLKIGGPSSQSLLSPKDTEALDQAMRNAKIATPSTQLLSGTPAFKEASSVLGSGALEYFVNISEIGRMANDVPTPAGFRAGTLLDALKLSAMHSVAGRVVLDGAKTRFQTAILGDTSEGSIFDIWGSGQAKPASVAYIPQDSVSYREFQVNLPGIYALALRVAKSFTAKGDDEKTDMFEAIARAKLGMSITEATHALSGELGYLQADSSYDLRNNTFFLGIGNRANALKLIRHAFIDNITSDTDLNGVTFLTLSSGNAQTPSGSGSYAAPKFQLAVTDDLILVSANKAALRAPLAKKKSPSTPGQLAPFFEAHSGVPSTVNGLSFVDFQKFDWQSLKQLPLQNVADKSTSKSMFPDKSTPPAQKSWLDEIDPKVFSRHLHLSYGYSWKDATGIHLEGWLD
jgi:hypothetical protein